MDTSCNFPLLLNLTEQPIVCCSLCLCEKARVLSPYIMRISLIQEPFKYEMEVSDQPENSHRFAPFGLDPAFRLFQLCQPMLSISWPFGHNGTDGLFSCCRKWSPNGNLHVARLKRRPVHPDSHVRPQSKAFAKFLSFAGIDSEDDRRGTHIRG